MYCPAPMTGAGTGSQFAGCPIKRRRGAKDCEGSAKKASAPGRMQATVVSYHKPVTKSSPSWVALWGKLCMLNNH